MHLAPFIFNNSAQVKRYTSELCFFMVSFIALHRYSVFYRLKVCVVTLHWASRSVPFFLQHLLILCLCVIWSGNSHNTSNFSLHLLWWSVINDLWYYYCDCFGVPWTTSTLDDKLNGKTLCVFWLLHWPTTAPPLSPSSGCPIPWDTILKLHQFITVHSLRVQMKGRVPRLLF